MLLCPLRRPRSKESDARTPAKIGWSLLIFSGLVPVLHSGSQTSHPVCATVPTRPGVLSLGVAPACTVPVSCVLWLVSSSEPLSLAASGDRCEARVQAQASWRPNHKQLEEGEVLVGWAWLPVGGNQGQKDPNRSGRPIAPDHGHSHASCEGRWRWRPPCGSSLALLPG